MNNIPVRIFRGEVFSFKISSCECWDTYDFYPDGGLVVSDGKIIEAGPYAGISRRYPGVETVDYSGKLLMPGFIDTHIHYSQSGIIGMYGKQLLDWLNEYTYPAETSFSSFEYAKQTARKFINELLRNGTTTCMAYATVHPGSVSALFEVATAYNMRLMTGKVLMDRNAPDELLIPWEQAEEETIRLIETWHNRGRNQYAITPRFAISCSSEQLRSAARLHRRYPDTYIQTHLSENKNEIEQTLSLFPGCRDYLEVYEREDLLTDRTVFAHCIHLSDGECKRLSEAGSILAHCPTSNFFLGSGLYDMQRMNRAQLRTTIATDIGAGTSFSMLRTLGESYKMQQLKGYSMSLFESFYRSTLGAAVALGIADKIGSFAKGHEADFIVVDYAVSSVQRMRRDFLQQTGKWNLQNKLFGLQTLGDERNIAAVYLMGQRVTPGE